MIQRSGKQCYGKCEKHESTVDIDYDELLNHVDTDDDQNNEDQHEEESEYGIMRPHELLDLDLDSENNGNNSVNLSSVSTATVTNLTLPNDEYYIHMCTLLNECQQHQFNYVMQWAAKYYFAERNDVSEPD